MSPTGGRRQIPRGVSAIEDRQPVTLDTSFVVEATAAASSPSARTRYALMLLKVVRCRVARSMTFETDGRDHPSGSATPLDHGWRRRFGRTSVVRSVGGR
jgi:hypothetical protein